VSPSFGPFWRTLVAFFLVGWHFEAQAAATITFSQVGNDVQASLTGTLSLAGLTADGAGITPNARVRGGGLGANVVLGPSTNTAATSYSPISGPQSIGCSTSNIDASSGSAGPNGPFGINMSGNRLLVPVGFVSGSNVTASATWTGATISSLGLTSGTYVYTWGLESLTIIIPGPSGCIPTLSIANTPQTYTGSPFPATVTCSSGGVVSNVQYNGSSTVPTNAGTYAVTANCAASSNYSAVTGASAGNFVIGASPTPPIPFVPSPTMQTTVSTGGSVNLSITGGNGNPDVSYRAVALQQAQAAAQAVSPRTGVLVCRIDGSVLTPTGGTGVCQVTATQGAYGNYQAQTTIFNITVTAVPSPVPIPTLSEWAEIMMMFLMILTVGWHFRKQQN